MKIYLYNVTDEYVNYLRLFDSNVCDNKVGKRKHIRKYIGAIFEINGIKYFAPLSSPKAKDYNADGTIRRDPLFLMRIISTNEKGETELKGKILIGNMIPVNENAVKKVNPARITDKNYRTLLIKELDFITKNTKELLRKATIIYNQKTGKYPVKKGKGQYLKTVVNFELLEKKSKQYLTEKK